MPPSPLSIIRARQSSKRLNPSSSTPTPNSNGQSAPPASSLTSSPYATQPVNVSKAFVPKALSTEKEYQTMTLKDIVSAVADCVEVAADLVGAVTKLRPYIAGLMAIAETKYKSGTAAGESKLAIVMEMLQGIAATVKVDWSDGLQAVLSQIAAVGKAAYNKFVSFGSPSVSDAAGA